MIKNLLWKQALELAKKKFGNLNTNQANKWLVDKYNALLGKENTKNIANKIREDLKRDRPFEGFKPEVVPPQVVPTPKKFNPFKKEGKKIDFMDYLAKRKRGEFDDGGIILPQPKPYNFEEKIEFLKKIKSGVGPKTYLQLMSHYLNEGVEKGAISKSARDNFLKGFTGTISEDWTSAIDDENLYMYEGDYERYPPKKFDEGGFTGSDIYFQDKFNEYDFATRYNNMSPKEGFDQLIQDYKNAMKMEEGELGKLPPIPLSVLKSGLGYLLKQLAGGKFNQERRDVLEFFAKPGKPTDLTNKLLHARVKKKSDNLSKKIIEKMSKYATKHAEGGLAGMLGETQPQQVGYAADRTKIVKELYDKAGGFDGTGKTFEEFMADVLFEGDYLAKGGRVGLAEGDTPSQAWMRDYFYDAGYDDQGVITLDEYMNGPIGWNDYMNHGPGKYAEGGIIGLKNGGLLEKYKEYTPKGPWTRGLTDAEITFELYNLLEPYMSLFMKEGGRVGFSEGKGLKNPGRRKFMKIAAALAAMIPGVKWGAKAIKPAAKAMDDIKINLRGDGDWEQDIDGMWSGGNWVNYSFEALTDKGKQILAKLSKGKNSSLVDQGDGVYFPGKVVKSKSHVGGQYLTDEADHAVDAVDAIKKSKGNISLNTQVGKKTKGIDKSQITKNSTQNFKTYSSKNINKQTILDEVDDYYAHDMGGYSRKHFDDDSVEMILDILDTTKKAQGGRVGLYKGGIIDLLIKGGKFLNKNSPVELYKKYLKSVKDRTLKANKTGNWRDLPWETIPIGAGGALVTRYMKKVLESLDEKPEEKAEGGRIGLDAGGPPISPANLHPLQRPMFYQGGLTKTVPPQRGPMPQGLQSDVYDGIMRPGVINGRN